MNFKSWWKEFNKAEDKLSERQLSQVQDKIDGWDKKHVIYSDKVKRLSRQVPKLKEPWKAERVVRTEDKRNESVEVKEDAEELGFKRFKIMLSPNACKTCRNFTNEGNKIFPKAEMKKGQWDVPPIHPNCDCVAIPYD